MFFPEPKYQGGSVFNPSSYDCNNCCGGGDGAQGPVGPAGPAAPVVPSVAFSVNANAQTLPASVYTVVAFDIEEYDTNSFFNPTSATVGGIPAYSFKPTVAGYYQVNSAVNIQPNSTAVHDTLIVLNKNGVEFKRGFQLNALAVSVLGCGVSASVYLNGSTDYLSISVFSTIAATISQNGPQSYFDGYLTANGQVGATGPTGPAAPTTTPTGFINTGSAGGNGLYFTIGTMKFCTGRTGQLTSPSNVPQTANNYAINWPVGFFSAVFSYTVTIDGVGGQQIQWCSGDGVNTSFGRFYVQSSTSTAATCNVSWIATGL
jgi:hypothetical protein